MLGDRWRHVCGGARQAAAVESTVSPDDGNLLVAAAWLHDIGYGVEAWTTGFHPLDGAWYLQNLGVERRLCCLVAHHSGAWFEAKERGLTGDLAAFELEDSPVMDALVYADMTTDAQGQQTTLKARIGEVLARYAPTDPVHQAIFKARSTLTAYVERTEHRIAMQAT